MSEKVWKVLYLLPWVMALGVICWLVEMRVPIDGKREFAFPFDGKSLWFDAFLPGTRASQIGKQEEGWVGQRIFAEPVYSSLRLPGVYTQADIGLSFRPVDQPLIEMGVREEAASSFAMQPLWSEALARGWTRVTWKGRQGYVREGEQASALEEEDWNQVLTWYATTTAPLLMDKEKKSYIFSTALSGSHDIHVIPVEGEIELDLVIEDKKPYRQIGSAIFSLSNNGVLIWSETLPLVGRGVDLSSYTYEKHIHLKDQKPGVYKLSFTADDEVVIKTIRSPMRHWVLGPRLYLADSVSSSSSTQEGKVWTNARHVLLQAMHEQGLQTISWGSRRVEIQAPYQDYRLDRDSQETSQDNVLVAPQGNVRIIGDGYFSFAPELLFLPAPRRLTDASQPIAEGIKAILTPYEQPTLEAGGWYKGSIKTPLQGRPGTLRLSLGVPGIGERKGFVDIRAAHLIYSRQALSWASAIWREMVAAWHRL